MKVLMVGRFYPPQFMGGIDSAMQDLSESLAGRGVDVDVVVSNINKPFHVQDINGVTVYRVKRAPEAGPLPASFYFPFFMRKLLSRKKYDVIHLHYPYLIAELSCLLIRLNAKLVITYHTGPSTVTLPQKIFSTFMGPLFNKAETIILSSDNLLGSAKNLRKYRKKCTVIPLFIKDNWFESILDETVDDIKAKYGVFVLFAGRFDPLKGIHTLLHAVRDLDCNVVLAGKGPQLDTLKSLVVELGIERRVFFVGALEKERLRAFYNASYTLCLPSVKESYGLVLLEAMAAGTPVIATDLGTGTTFINKDGETGLVVQPGNIDMLAAAIGKLLGDENLTQRMGMAAKARAEQFFSEEVVIQHILEVYKT